jgi:Ca2+:H+ antiporter
MTTPSLPSPDQQDRTPADREPLWRRLLTLSNLWVPFLLLAVVLEVRHVEGLWLFLAAAAAIIPLAGLMGTATESLAERIGPAAGALLNATFGNAAELIIALMVLARAPDPYPLVKASITGSILGNLLLVLGLSILAGGLRYPRQQFDHISAGVGTTLMALACIGLIVPTLFFYLFRAGTRLTEDEVRNIRNLSEEIAVILAVVYALSLVFTLYTHRSPEPESEPPVHAPGPRWGLGRALLVLVGATAGIAVLSEWLVDAVGPAAEALGMSTVFVGVVVVAIIGNAAEHSTAVVMAWKNRMDLAVQIAVGSSTQVALFVAPVLVFASLLMGHSPSLDLHFTPLEIAAILLSVGVIALVCHDGESNWFEGVLLLAVYAIFALAFYHLPVPEPIAAP